MSMPISAPILATKLYIPLPRPKAVHRHRLIERLNEGLHRKFTLISAPAGFGKTTLVSEWLSAPTGLHERPLAWLSLDEADNDPTRFLAYLIAAVQTIAPKVGIENVSGEDMGSAALALLHSTPPASIEAILTALLNEIATIPEKFEDKFVLVLDDYHVIDTRAIDQALTFLLEHLPPAVHVVITTREDPPLPLARYRSRGHMTEVRATELRFTALEAADFLNQVMGLQLSPQEVAALEGRTEGWIAGLQLAALSIQGHPDVAAFIRAFAGDHRYLVDYLVEEVLHQQPKSVQTLLLHTSILDRLCGPLCDAVTGQAEGRARLEILERGNFFVVPLDDKRHWYRYHHLFAEVLQARLLEQQPDQITVLHRRASEWYAANGLPADAIRHALAAKDFARAAELIELTVPAMQQGRQEATALGWLKSLPNEMFYNRPVLSFHYAGTLLSCGETEGIEALLQNVERWLDSGRDHDMNHNMIVVDEAQFRKLPATIAIYRAGFALTQGDVPSTLRYARHALEIVPVEDHLWRGAAGALLGLAYWTNGDLEIAYRTYTEGLENVVKAGNIADAVASAITRADIRVAQGRLHEAMRFYEQGLRVATAQDAPVLRGAADMHVGMSELYRERNDLDRASQHLQKSKELGEHNGFPQNPYRWRVAMARLRAIEADFDGALALLTEAERVYSGDFSPNVRPIAAIRARIWLAQGRISEALAWAHERGLTREDELTYLAEYEHITLARIFVARHQRKRDAGPLQDTVAFLDRLLEAAKAGGRTKSVIEILVLQALAHQTQGNLQAALDRLHDALTLAEPENYVRTFVDEGASVAQLLREAAGRGILPDYTGRLLAAFGTGQSSGAGESPRPTVPASQPLIEPLSQRELEVLRLLRSELSGPEIADHLVVALSTVRTHTKGIFSKLHVNSRRAAVKRAEELHLI